MEKERNVGTHDLVQEFIEGFFFTTMFSPYPPTQKTQKCTDFYRNKTGVPLDSQTDTYRNI